MNFGGLLSKEIARKRVLASDNVREKRSRTRNSDNDKGTNEINDKGTNDPNDKGNDPNDKGTDPNDKGTNDLNVNEKEISNDSVNDKTLSDPNVNNKATNDPNVNDKALNDHVNDKRTYDPNDKRTKNVNDKRTNDPNDKRTNDPTASEGTNDPDNVNDSKRTSINEPSVNFKGSSSSHPDRKRTQSSNDSDNEETSNDPDSKAKSRDSDMNDKMSSLNDDPERKVNVNTRLSDDSSNNVSHELGKMSYDSGKKSSDDQDRNDAGIKMDDPESYSDRIASDEPERKDKKVSDPGSGKVSDSANRHDTNDIRQDATPVSDTQLDETLRHFNVYDSSASKTDKITTLDILLQQQQRDSKYKTQLDLEKTVDPHIDVHEITNSEHTNKLYLQLRVAVKRLVYRWDSHIQQLDDPELIEHQQQLLHETKRDLVTLLYRLRSRKLKPDMLVSLATIVHYVQQHNFNRANECYLKLSIGNVAWPIGVKSIGIHARSASSKITGENKAANIMIDDKTRRWITAIKRLITFSESQLA